MAYCHHKTFLVKTEFEDELLYGIDNIKVTFNKNISVWEIIKEQYAIYLYHTYNANIFSFLYKCKCPNQPCYF